MRADEHSVSGLEEAIRLLLAESIHRLSRLYTLADKVARHTDRVDRGVKYLAAFPYTYAQQHQEQLAKAKADLVAAREDLQHAVRGRSMTKQEQQIVYSAMMRADMTLGDLARVLTAPVGTLGALGGRPTNR